jgi:hypothetical protein
MLLGTVGLNLSQVIIGQVHNMVGEKNEKKLLNKTGNICTA